MNRTAKIIREEMKDTRKYIYSIIILFAVSCILGFAFSGQLGFIDSIIRSIIGRVAGLSGFSLIVFIFANNAQSALFGMLLGLAFGIFPVFNAVLNGTVIGYVLAKVAAAGGISEFWRILPHGIFELPAIFISLGLGLRLGAVFFTKAWKKEMGKRLVRAGIVFLYVVLPLLIIAAVIEGLLITFYK